MLKIAAIPIVSLCLALGLAGCDGDSSCDPGEVQLCPCGGGQPEGTQVCTDDGSRWGPCDCSGADGDGDVDSDADVDSDVDGDGDTDVDGDGGGDGDVVVDGDEDDACVPDCNDRECGPDGCGGTCPPGCEGTILECARDDGVCRVVSRVEARFPITGNPDEVGGEPSTDYFDPIEGGDLDLVVSFRGVSETCDTSFEDHAYPALEIVGTAEVEIRGPAVPLVDALATRFASADLRARYFAWDGGGAWFDIDFNVTDVGRTDTIRIELSCVPDLADLPFGPFETDCSILADYPCVGSGALYRTTGSPSRVTDQAFGDASIEVFVP